MNYFKATFHASCSLFLLYNSQDIILFDPGFFLSSRKDKIVHDSKRSLDFFIYPKPQRIVELDQIVFVSYSRKPISLIFYQSPILIFLPNQMFWYWFRQKFCYCLILNIYYKTSDGSHQRDLSYQNCFVLGCTYAQRFSKLVIGTYSIEEFASDFYFMRVPPVDIFPKVFVSQFLDLYLQFWKLRKFFCRTLMNTPTNSLNCILIKSNYCRHCVYLELF